MIGREDIGTSAMKCTPQNTMNSASGRAAAHVREFEGVAGHVGEFAQPHRAGSGVRGDEDAIAECRLGGSGTRDEFGIARFR